MALINIEFANVKIIKYVKFIANLSTHSYNPKYYA